METIKKARKKIIIEKEKGDQYYIKKDVIYDRYPIYRDKWGNEGIQAVAKLIPHMDVNGYKIDVKHIKFLSDYQENGNRISAEALVEIAELVKLYESILMDEWQVRIREMAIDKNWDGFVKSQNGENK